MVRRSLIRGSKVSPVSSTAWSKLLAGCFLAITLSGVAWPFRCMCVSAEKPGALIPSGNITIVWHVIKWTSDGYIVNVTLYNCHEDKENVYVAPAWTLGWTWMGQEVVREAIGAQIKDRSMTKSNIIVIPTDASNSFCLVFTATGKTRKTIKVPRNVTFQAAKISYNCGPTKLVKPLQHGLTRTGIAWRVTCELTPRESLLKRVIRSEKISRDEL